MGAAKTGGLYFWKNKYPLLSKKFHIARTGISNRYGIGGFDSIKNTVVVNQKLNTLASAAMSMRWGPPSSIMLEKNLCSST